MIQHEMNHQTVNRNIDEDLTDIIVDMCARSSPSRICKELKSKRKTERIINLTL
jgi:hypothetical protein